MNGELVVVDTSVLVKWFRQHEVDAEAALALRNAYLEGHTMLVAPLIALYEFANVMRYKDDLTTEQVQAAYQSLLDMGITWLEPTAAIMSQAIALARRYDTPIYDAAFAALAEDFGALYITADVRFVKKVQALEYVRRL